MGSLPQKKQAGIIAFVAAMLLLPAFLFGAGGHDLHCQSLWTREFARQFWEGNLYPRWLMAMYGGNGSPVFFYYPPLAYYVSAFFYILLPHGVFDYLPMACSALVAVFCSGVAFFVWAGEEASVEAALWGGLVYMAAPAYVGFNFYDILLYSTVWSFVWLPVMLFFMRAIVTRWSYGVIGFALSLGAMIMTNIPSTVVCGPLVVLYGVFICQREDYAYAALRIGLAVLLGFSLSAVFLFPSLMYLNYTMANFQWAPMNKAIRDYVFVLGSKNLPQIIHTLLWLFYAAVYVAYYAITRNSCGRTEKFWLAAILFVLAMNSIPGGWVWDSVFFLRLLQEPSRFFIIAALGTGFLLTSMPQRYGKMRPFLLAISLVFTFWLALESRMNVETFRHDYPADYQRYSLNIDQYTNYLGYLDLVKRYYDKHNLEEIKQDTERAHLMDGNAQLQILRWQPRNIAFSYKATSVSHVRIHQMFFPGWQAYIGTQPLETAWDGPSGQIVITLPPGEGEAALKLTPLWPEIAGRFVSMLTILIMVIIFLIQHKKPAYSIARRP